MKQIKVEIINVCKDEKTNIVYKIGDIIEIEESRFNKEFMKLNESIVKTNKNYNQIDEEKSK